MENITDELERLESLRQRGALSETEFDQAKARLLASTDAPVVVHEPTPTKVANEELWIMGIHLGQLLNGAGGIGLVLPIVLWLIKKDQSPLIDAHGKNAINWLISVLIYGVICFFLMAVFIGAIGFILLTVLAFVFPIIAAIKAANGEVWEYPMSFRFIK